MLISSPVPRRILINLTGFANAELTFQRLCQAGDFPSLSRSIALTFGAGSRMDLLSHRRGRQCPGHPGPARTFHPEASRVRCRAEPSPFDRNMSHRGGSQESVSKHSAKVQRPADFLTFKALMLGTSSL